MTLIHVAVSLSHGGPVAVPDVSAYLSFSQWLYGGAIPDEIAFHPGYGLILGPFGWLPGEHLHTAALLFNSALAGVVVLLAAQLARALGATKQVVYLTVIISAVHPSVSTSSRIAWPETLLTVGLLTLGLLMASKRWSWIGFLVGLGFVVHPRTLVIGVAALVLSVLAKRFINFVVGFLPAAGIAALCLELTNSWPSGRVSAAQTLGEAPGPFATFLGQWLAISAGTAGIASVAIVISIANLRALPKAIPAAFFGLSALGMLILGGWVLAGSDRADTLIYGRYMGPWAIPLCIVGLIAISNTAVTFRMWIIAITPTILGVAVVATQGGAVTEGPRGIMTLGLSFLWKVSGDNLISTVLLAGLVAVAGVAVARRSLVLSLLILASVALPSSLLNHRHLANVGQIAAGQVTVKSSLPAEVSCLAHDNSTKNYALWLYRLELPKTKHQRVDLSAGDKPCGPYVIAGTDALSLCAGAELLSVEPRAQWGLWRLPSQGCA